MKMKRKEEEEEALRKKKEEEEKALELKKQQDRARPVSSTPVPGIKLNYSHGLIVDH